MSEWPFRLGSGRSVHVLPFSLWLILLFRRPLLEGEAAPDRAAAVAQPAVVLRALAAVEPEVPLVLEQGGTARADGVAAAGRLHDDGVEHHDPVPEGDGEVLDGAGLEANDFDDHFSILSDGIDYPSCFEILSSNVEGNIPRLIGTFQRNLQSSSFSKLRKRDEPNLMSSMPNLIRLPCWDRKRDLSSTLLERMVKGAFTILRSRIAS